MAALRAFKQEAVALGPHARAAAAGAGGGGAPARLDPIGPAVLLGREPRLELLRRLGKVTPQVVVVLLRHGPPPGRPSCRMKLRRIYGDRHASPLSRIRRSIHHGFPQRTCCAKTLGCRATS